MKRTLEERVTEGRSTFIERIEYFPAEERRTRYLVDDPEQQGHTREFTVTDVVRFSSNYFIPEGFEADVLESLTRPIEHTAGRKMDSFTTTTCNRELTITTRNTPLLHTINV